MAAYLIALALLPIVTALPLLPGWIREQRAIASLRGGSGSLEWKSPTQRRRVTRELADVRQADERQRAADLAWARERADKARRSAAARKGWETRRAKAAASTLRLAA